MTDEQKVRELAFTLKRQGIANSMMDAMERARAILSITAPPKTEKDNEIDDLEDPQFDISKQDMTINELLEQAGIEAKEIETHEAEQKEQVIQAEKVVSVQQEEIIQQPQPDESPQEGHQVFNISIESSGSEQPEIKDEINQEEISDIKHELEEVKDDGQPKQEVQAAPEPQSQEVFEIMSEISETDFHKEPEKKVQENKEDDGEYIDIKEILEHIDEDK